MPTNSKNSKAKFTRGEKCLFIHLIVTFSLIMLMIIIYFVHLCLVNHTKTDVLKIYRRSYDRSLSGLSLSDYQSVGVMFLNITPPVIVCNTLLLGKRWSLAPAQCTSMREDPDMSDHLLQWKLKYKLDGKQTNTNVKRTLTHSHFSRDDYQNNIGLFEHADPIERNEYYVVPRSFFVNDETLQKYIQQMSIIDWDIHISEKGDTSDSITNQVRPVLSDKCEMYANTIVEKIRNYEFCVTFKETGFMADHGAMFVMNAKIIGFFSWGDTRARGMPLIILNILRFREWFESIIY
ncbi:unnamed protein product [Spodoptera littoralis]|uniref:Peptidase S1 domain-containing protein n=1 Tax=Spodoptera littoralis TaxID=7109 RepID=A0A9P0NAK8_SPOLI|nr:unnamed protein product [Spodoptera littoralis]CAH1647517.1 unnamed protein product [Spodoptera littoralis]